MADSAIAYFPQPGDQEQARAVAAFVRRRGWVLVEPFVESPGGGHAQLERALAHCRETGAILVLPSLAAAGRDGGLLDAVLEARVRVAALDRTRVGRATLELLREVARERSARISARSREALRRARARGVRIGSPRPEIGARRAGAVLRDRADLRARELAPLLDEIRLSNPGISLRGMAQVLSEQGVATPRGGRWGPSTVKSILDRSDDPGRSG